MNKTKKQPTLKASLLFVVLYYVILYVIASLPINIWQSLHIYHGQNPISFINGIFIAGHIMVACSAIILFRSHLKNNWQSILQHKGKTLLLWLGGLMAIFISGFLFIHGISDNEQTLTMMMKSISSWQLILFQIVIIFIGPLNEEILFREIMIGTLNPYISKYILLIISSAFFAYLHIPSLAEIHQALPYFINGLILGFVYIKGNNNVLTSYGLHLINNLLSCLL